MTQVDSDEAASCSRSEALRRKRERDKQNQRRKRHREREYIQTLLARIAQLKQDAETVEAEAGGAAAQRGSSGDTPSPRDRLCGLLEETPISDSGLGTTQLSDGTGRPSMFAPAGAESTNGRHVGLTTQSHSNKAYNEGRSPPHGLATQAIVPMRSIDVLLETPRWQRLPIISFLPRQVPQLLIRSESFGALLDQMRSGPVDDLASSPETPRALDLLFGGSSNLLANAISAEVAPYAFLPPEKFAISWLDYLILRWLAIPSPTSFSVIPDFCRPTASQLLVEHPICIDLIIWPSMRSRLAMHWRDYDLEAVFGLLGCTCRLRGVFNGKFMTREADGDPQVDESFLRLFTSKGGWGLLEKFWVEYPELVEDLDPDVLIREEHLLPP